MSNDNDGQPIADNPLRIVMRATAVPEHGRWQTFQHLPNDKPLPSIMWASVGTDDPMPAGNYVLTGEQDDEGRWVYLHDGVTA